MLVCDYIASRLKQEGVKVVFGYTGGNIVYCIDALQRTADIEFIENRHEQHSAFAANGAASWTGRITCAMVSSGPGALNLLTGIANAWYDSLPVLFIAGDVSRYQGKTLARQDAFQAAPIVQAASPFCKFASEIRTLDGIQDTLDHAFRELTSDRPGPVLLSISHAIQRSVLEPEHVTIDTEGSSFSRINYEISPADSAKIKRVLTSCRAPLLLIGGGAKSSAEALSRLLRRKALPVTASLRGLSFLDQSIPSFMGLIGDYGHKAANAALASCDCLIALGTRLDERQTWALKKCNPCCHVVHVDIDQTELFEGSEYYLPVRADASALLALLDDLDLNEDIFLQWREQLQQLRAFFPRVPPQQPLHELIFQIGRLMPPGTSFFADVGMNQMVTAQALHLHAGQQFFTSAGLGAMGYAIPAAAGAAAAIRAEGKLDAVVAITGDGGFQMSMADLGTIQKEQLPLKMIVINNGCLGMIRNLQNHIMSGRLTASVDGYSVCNIEKIAETFNLKYLKITPYADISTISDVLLDAEEPILIEICCSYEESIPFPNGPCDLTCN